MTRLTIAKAALALAGALVFGWGVRSDDATFRWAGIALMAAALGLRFRRTPSDRGASGGDGGDQDEPPVA